MSSPSSTKRTVAAVRAAPVFLDTRRPPTRASASYALLMAHAPTAQACVSSAGSPVGETCLQGWESALGPQMRIAAGGGRSAGVHPFDQYLAGPHTGADERE
ncbi:hypothetical protein SAMN05421870_103119 [Streptomyces qinglanensis]|uniref:Uncharacterized protein n=2 Tax=Streptomyces qinglanensis TaxID=943816 RepID=A0A1H9QWD9_9ACTN|nr:hypothetical protein SAMN05421870_103119 [Streptomyces qinglanensis]